MKLIRFGETGNETPGIITEDGKRMDVSSFGEDYDQHFFETNGIERLRVWLEKNKKDISSVSDKIRLGPPLKGTSKIVCVGLNYAKHAEESGMAVPKEPVLFFKATTAIVGPNDSVMIPKGSKKTDWEVELAVVIGKRASYVEEEDALDFVAGYLLHNDYSERKFQLEQEGQWVKGKSCDTFAPIGPWIATKEDIPNPHDLRLWLKVNGETLQDSSTSDLIFNVPELVSYISRYMTLLPGDIISTGTPFGVGLGLTPPRFLKPGDIVELGIDGLGTSKQIAKAYTK